MTLTEFNKPGAGTAAKELLNCCGSSRWVSLMMEQFPFNSEKELVYHATITWYEQCNSKDWLEAFSHHPKIGDTKSLTEKFAGKEQAGIAAATAETIEALANANAAYEKKFGFIFIVCATGRSAAEMLRLLEDRLSNTVEEEVNIAMGEQQKITIIRFKKLLEDANWDWLQPCQLTTHVLNTSIGKPGKDITIRLKTNISESWQTMAQGVTNADGRIADLLPPEKILTTGNYKMVFETAKYFATNNTKGFYPEVEISFSITDDAHYHVPLLINPFGYSTYRGS